MSNEQSADGSPSNSTARSRSRGLCGRNLARMTDLGSLASVGSESQAS